MRRMWSTPVLGLGAALVFSGMPNLAEPSPLVPQTGAARSARAATVVLGSASHAFHGEGWGRAHPATIFNGGDPSGLVTHITWRHWGAQVSTGRGLNAIFKPGGGYYPRQVWIRLKAERVGRCTATGPLAYERLLIRAPSRPGGPLGSWVGWGGGVGSVC